MTRRTDGTAGENRDEGPGPDGAASSSRVRAGRGADPPHLARGDDTSPLGSALAELESGCGLLVTGDAPTAAFRVATSRYFGVPSRRRRRLLCLTNPPARTDAWLPGAVTAAHDDAAAVRLGPADPRSASGDVRGDGRAHGPGDDRAVDRLRTDDAGPVREALFGRLDALAGSEGSLDRLELRVGLFRVDQLRHRLGDDAADALLRELAAATRDRGGLAHFHLPRPVSDVDAPRDDPVVGDVTDALGDAVDAVVQLRGGADGVPEERWSIDGWGVTEWSRLG
ncbi:DUF7504 family protein [Halobaculum sp. D14]|uniref:DUF7504 family protein n=1 Tax=unclassified Halobaculum TaxID=2640896 RepID=UPI003EBB7327